MSDALTVSDQERETRRAGAVYPTPSPAPRPQRLQRSETLSEAEKRVLDPAMAADAASLTARAEAPPAVGSVVTFKYAELTNDGVPRFPSFLRPRPDVSADGF